MTEQTGERRSVPMDWWTRVETLTRGHAIWRTQHVRCWQTRDDFIAESIALAWQQAVRIWIDQTHPLIDAVLVGRNAVRAALAGHRLEGPPREGFSPPVKPNRAVTYSPRIQPSAVLDDFMDTSRRGGKGPVWTPLDAAALSLDFDAWVSTLTPSRCDAVLCWASGMDNAETAREIGLSYGRVCTIRMELRQQHDYFA